MTGLVRTHALDSALLTQQLEVALDGFVRHTQRQGHLLRRDFGLGTYQGQNFGREFIYRDIYKDIYRDIDRCLVHRRTRMGVLQRLGIQRVKENRWAVWPCAFCLL